MMQGHKTLMKVIAHKMIVHLYVLSPLMEHKVPGDVNGRLAVTIYYIWFRRWHSQFFKNSAQLNLLMYKLTEGPESALAEDK